MSVFAWIGLVWIYLYGFFALIGLPRSIRRGRIVISENNGVMGMTLGILNVLAILAVWSSSSFAWALAALVILLVLEAVDAATFLRSVRDGYKDYSLRSGLVDLAWVIVELALISLLAFA